jgi:Cu+-exporting ATPase
MYVDASKALNVFTAVLIIACPCAIALAAPFTLGNMLRIFGKQKFYLKNATVIEKLASLDTIIFDKTGTLTTHKENTVSYDGDALNQQEKSMLKSSLRASNHPLSRTLYNSFEDIETLTISDYKEIVGKGIQASFQDMNLKLGASTFVCNDVEKSTLDTSVHVSFNEVYKGKFTFKNSYRTGVEFLFNSLKNEYELSVVSGDNQGEKEHLQESLPRGTQLLFNQKPEDKLNVVANLQEKNKKVMMIGDGLNDAGALAQSDVGIALSENINVFSPACDGILDASKFNKIANYIKASKKAMQIIKYCFILSLCYNVVGLYFAVTGQLMPVIAAILMPLSSISIVVFTTISTNILGKKIQ